MKNYRKHIDDFFREKLGRYRETPPADVWEGLESRLDGLAAQPGFPYRWLKHFAIVSLIVFFGASVVKKMTGNTDMQNIALAGTTTDKTGSTGTTTTNNTANVTTTHEQAATTNDQQVSNTPTAATANNTTSTNQPTATRHNTARAAKATGNNQKTVNTTPVAKVYNASFTQPAEKEPAFDNSNGGPSANTETPAPAIAKKEVAQLTAATQTATSKTTQPDFRRFEAGMKVGYEGGFSDKAAMKLVVSPYLQYNLSEKFSVMTQPAVKYATITTKNIGAPESYYKENGDSAVKEVTTPKIVGGTTVYNSTYTYTQTHDSIVKSYAYRGTYIEVEVPLLLKYNISKKVSVYGGVNVNYSKQTGITENTYTKQGIQRTVVETATDQGVAAPPASVSSVMTYTGKPITSYTGTPYTTPQGNLLHAGYMVGFSYEYTKKWMVDALLQQTPAPANMQGGYNVNNTLSTTYFRVSIGYKFTK